MIRNPKPNISNIWIWWNLVGRGKTSKSKAGAPTVTPEKIQKSASFQRKRAKLSPMAILSKRSCNSSVSVIPEPSSVSVTHDPSSVSVTPEPSSVSVIPEPCNSGEAVIPALKELQTKMRALGLPSELLPNFLPRGKKSYTVHAKDHKASLQVLHAKQQFFLNCDRHGAVPEAQTVTWATHPTPELAWKFVKQTLDW